MHGIPHKSVKQKVTLTGIHFVALLVSAWILFGTGGQFISQLFGDVPNNPDFIPRIIVFTCAIIYFVRVCITGFVLLKRKMPWNEVFEVGVFIAFIQVFFAILTVYHKETFKSYDYMLIAIYVFGAYLNTFSEWGRMIWKKDPVNKGKLYTKGLFKYSMHINYLKEKYAEQYDEYSHNTKKLIPWVY